MTDCTFEHGDPRRGREYCKTGSRWEFDLRYRFNVATLKHAQSGATWLLGARHLVGRSPTCQLRLTTPSVSGVHAELSWNGSSWHVQDLGSRNGTFVNGRKLGPGEQATLAGGAKLTFGVPEHCFELIDASGPCLSATADNGEVVLGSDGILSLPTVDRCELSIFYSPTEAGWVAESETETRLIEDQGLVVVDGLPWRVTLPAEAAETREATSHAHEEPGLGDIQLVFFVSRDGEHVSVQLVDGRGARVLEDRSHHMLLLTLARTRLTDAAQPHLPASEHGWMYRDELERVLDVDGQLLNLWVHRARRQLAELGVRGAGGLVERRSQVQQLRIGVAELVINDA
jgi:hypothetical protein